MQLSNRVVCALEELQADADAELVRLLGPVTSEDYRQFLERTFGFVAPLERSLWATTGLEKLVDMRRFRKQALLRADLLGFGLKREAVDALPRCSVPRFESPEVALGWAYLVERSTLLHVRVFMHLASVIPGEVAYSATYLRAHVGAVEENWNRFVDALDSIAAHGERADALVAAGKAAFRAHRRWRDLYDRLRAGDRHERVA